MEIWYTYILLCENGFLYTGIAKDIEKRFDLHVSGKGAKFTQKNKPIKIVYAKKHKNRSNALKHEVEIKKMTRPGKDELIGGV